jgi:hypothetical protein
VLTGFLLHRKASRTLITKEIHNITVTILDIIHRPVFYIKHDVSDTGFCLRLQAKPTQMGPIELVSVPEVRKPFRNKRHFYVFLVPLVSKRCKSWSSEARTRDVFRKL